MTALAPARTVTDLSYLLDHTSHVLRTQVAAALAEIGLTPRMHCVLAHAVGAQRTQIQLAELGDMDKTTMVVTMDALEKAGLAERRPSSTDRRARIVVVTEAGTAVAKRSQETVDGVHRAALEALPKGERAVLVRALDRLATGHLARPDSGAQTVRRARERSN